MTLERRQWFRSDAFIVNFEHISHLALVFEHVNFEHADTPAVNVITRSWVESTTVKLTLVFAQIFQ